MMRDCESSQYGAAKDSRHPVHWPAAERAADRKRLQRQRGTEAEEEWEGECARREYDADEEVAVGKCKLEKAPGEDASRLLQVFRRRHSAWTMALLAFLLLQLAVYLWPIDWQVEPRVAAPNPRPPFEGPLAVNERLETAERLFEGQFHAAESMAWTRDSSAFYTGVEGGFILRVEPQANKWSVAARLNAHQAVEDHSQGVAFVGLPGGPGPAAGNGSGSGSGSPPAGGWVPFCGEDVELYGPEAEFEPARVYLSRCSRPLGLRLSPDESYLYAMDPLSGLFRVDLAAGRPAARVRKLIDFKQWQLRRTEPVDERRIVFGDDIAVEWAATAAATAATTTATTTTTTTRTGDTIYLSDCSARWPLRHLLWLILENDDTGRVLAFDTASRQLRQVLPAAGAPSGGSDDAGRPQEDPDTDLSGSRLSFPNGVEVSANGSALLISDLNNRRILVHHLRGARAGHTQRLLAVPGYSDNVRRGADLPDGRPTYWTACGCAVSDSPLELGELLNGWPRLRRLLLRWLHLAGRAARLAGELARLTPLVDFGEYLAAGWFKLDPYCAHGLVLQFDETGAVLQSLHAPHFGSHWRLLSEARQVSAADGTSWLYLGSVYYSYLGRLRLA